MFWVMCSFGLDFPSASFQGSVLPSSDARTSDQTGQQLDKSGQTIIITVKITPENWDKKQGIKTWDNATILQLPP